MGICASCLGLNRHSSAEHPDESDSLLADSQHLHYGSGVDEAEAPADEDELRREREALEQITSEASENMIDVSHASAADLTQYHHGQHEGGTGTMAESADRDDGKGRDPEDEDDNDDAEETAWLLSLRAEEADEIKGLDQSGGLTMDIGQLRQDSVGSRKGLKPAR